MKQDGPEKAKYTRAQRLQEVSQQRREQEKQDVRRAILQASTALFLQHGYEKFSLRQVAEQIGYSPGNLYLYFKDKDEVLFTIMMEGVKRFSDMLTEAAQESDPRTRLGNIGRAYVDFGTQNPAHFQLMFMQRTDYLLRVDESARQPVFAIFALWGAVIEEAMKAGILRMGDPTSTGDALWALLHGVVSIAILMPNFDRKRIQEMTDAAIEIVTTGIHK